MDIFPHIIYTSSGYFSNESTPSFDAVILTGAITQDTQAATKAYVDSTSAGFIHHSNCLVATTENLSANYSNGKLGVGATLTNSGALSALSIDGVSLDLNDRALVKDQSATANNGIYFVSVAGSDSTAWVLTRATDYDAATEMTTGSSVAITEGTTNSRTTFFQSSVDVVTVGTTAIVFEIYGMRSGDVFGPQSSTDNALVRFDSTSGKLIQNSEATLSDSGELSSYGIQFSGIGARVLGDYSNATYASRALFQSSTLNSRTSVGAIPGGSNSISDFVAYANSDPNNSPFIGIGTNGTYNYIKSSKTGTGTTPNNLLFQFDITPAATLSSAGTFSSAKLQGTTVQAGSSGIVGIINLYPTTGNRGKVSFTASDNDGDTTTTVNFASHTQASVLTVPDLGATNSFVLTSGAQTLDGKTLTNAGNITSLTEITSPVFNGDLNGTAVSSYVLQIPRNIGGVAFDAESDIVPQTIQVVDTTDSTCSVALFDSATGDLQPKTDAGLTYDATTGILSATGLVAPISGAAYDATIASGKVGELVSASVVSGSSVSLTTGTSSNITSISLTTGKWRVWGKIGFALTGVTASTFSGGASTTSGSLGSEDQYFEYPADFAALSGNLTQNIPEIILTTSTTTTYYLVAQSTFTVGSVAAFGQIYAERYI